MHHTNEHLETISIECAKKKKYEHCTKIAICSLSCLSDDTPTYWFNLLPVLCCAVKSLCPKEENLRTHTCRRGRQDGWGRGRVTHSSVKHCPKWGQSALAFCVTELSFRSHHICLYYIYSHIYERRIQGCVAAVVLCFIFSLFLFLCWRTHKLKPVWTRPAPFVCLFICLYPAADESTFAFTQVTKHKPKNAPKSSGRGLHLREIRDNRTHRTHGTPDRKSRKQDTDTEIRLRLRIPSRSLH